ncbi:MAG: aminotransferase class III-fold pyridoxal phosphate-dependent enzyme [Bacteroidales bacterium]|nr:aminotransferase class III-fold pyridoxal phosphate-dependent enzyme [Bacteroidales bacterium]
MDLFDVYTLYDIEPVKGRGNYVFTADGTPYLDLYGGHAVISIGHCHPHYVDVVGHQLGRLGFYSNSVRNSLQEKVAELLGRASGYEDYSLFLCNSGAEANENALKLASFHTGKSHVLAFRHAFHGRTSGAVAVTDNPKIQSPFNRSHKVDFVELGDIEGVERALEKGIYCAVMIEGIQGVAGIQIPSDEFMQSLRDITKRMEVPLIVDEVQSGYGRTGRFFAHQYAGIRPDIITVAKGMGNGFPIGGVLISPMFTATKGMLGTTFGGNHLACAAAIAVLEVIEDEHLVENAALIGSYLLQELRHEQEKDKKILDVRGRGLMIGINVEGAASELRKTLLYDHHVFTGGAGASTIRLLPALTLPHDDAHKALKALHHVLH